MKWFNYILSVYLLVLSCLPCADKEPIHSISASTFTASHSEPEPPIHAEDGCSPLCICTCCSGFTIQANSFAVQQNIINTFQSEIPSYKQINCLDLLFSIWQPPKLS